MDIQKFLARIDYHAGVSISPDHETLKEIHRHHLFSVPFENLDVNIGRRFTLKKEEVYDKVVHRRRGGFCYELNFLFRELLSALGFSCHLISCRILTTGNVPGPEFDHMAVVVTTDRQWIADVGFGDLFLTPLEIKSGIQHDGRNRFSIEGQDDHYLLSMEDDEKVFQPKYVFTLIPRDIDDFAALCLDKQINPDSHFVQNTICTLPTAAGRITLYNNKFTERRNGERIEQIIETDESLRALLEKRFNISL